MPDPMRYEVRNEEIEKTLKEIGLVVRGTLPPGWGFNLMIFSYGADGGMFYCSSAKREDMIKAMQEFIAKFREN